MHTLKVLHIDACTSFYKMERYRLGEFFGPVDLGLSFAKQYNSLNIGAGIFAGSIFPGSNRLVISGFSTSWGNFYISSMGGAALVFDNLGINMVAIRGKTSKPSILYLNRSHGEEIEVEILPIDVHQIWNSERGGVYSLIDYTLNRFGEKYENDPRVLAVGPASEVTDMGAIASVPVKNGKATFVDTWAGRGGFGSKMFREHGIAAIIYGGTYIDEDFRDRKVADEWFTQKYNLKLATKDMEATTKYRFDPEFGTGGTFGVNYAKMGGNILAFNYKSIYFSEDERKSLHEHFIVNHYLKQFNEETIATKSFRTCGEPCSAVCKKMKDEFKKDYEPYQTMGPLCGVFDQRAAEKLTHYADTMGFDAISLGGVISWLMECLADGVLTPKECSVTRTPVFDCEGFRIETDSMINAQIGTELIDSIIHCRGILNLQHGARKFARMLAKERGKHIIDRFLFISNARNGWTVPNQYWTPGVLSPMPIMGKYYMHYGTDFLPPRELGRKNAERMVKELLMDNAGFCRFHRQWAEEMIPELIHAVFNVKEGFTERVRDTAIRINSRNAAIFWESSRNIDFVETFLIRKKEIAQDSSPELASWIDKFKKNRTEAAFEFWYEIRKGIDESLREL
ncbi:MAG: aldehyde ferredoxin oxidoreductase [Spirochaetes bacterium]|nr:aldehyde ferredoxin oxidoreductase [Spirochaetota bacterium]